MSVFGGGPSIPIPPPPPEIPPFKFPTIEMPDFPDFPTFDPEAGEARRRRDEQIRNLRALERRRKGYGATLLTGGEGVEADARVRRPGLAGIPRRRGAPSDEGST